jgi:hypothetical protein
MSALRVDELKKLIHGGDEEVQKELSALLKSYEIPEEHAEEVRHRLKELIREEVRRRGLQEEDWLIDALYRILIHMACAVTSAGTQPATEAAAPADTPTPQSSEGSKAQR